MYSTNQAGTVGVVGGAISLQPGLVLLMLIAYCLLLNA